MAATISWLPLPAITICSWAWTATVSTLVLAPPKTMPLEPNEQSNPLCVSLARNQFSTERASDV
jgi:hypothetical protein